MKEQFVKLIEENKRIILKVTNMYCVGVENKEDLFQDIIVQLWKAFPHFNENSKVSTWMYQVSLNTAITRLRKEKRRDEKYCSLSEEAFQLPSVTNSEIQDRLDVLQLAIQQLTNVEKGVMVLYMEGYSYKEMAEILGTTESNVGFKLNKIKSKLKGIVTKKNYGVG